MRPAYTDIKILQLISEGLKYEEISQKLGLSKATIKNRMWRCYYKLGAINAPHAMAIAMREGYIK